MLYKKLIRYIEFYIYNIRLNVPVPLAASPTKLRDKKVQNDPADIGGWIDSNQHISNPCSECV